MEHRVQFDSDGITLVGTLQMPSSDPPYPACLLLGGSGPQLRDGSFDYSREDFFPSPLFTRPILEIEARALEQVGVASLRYDKRGSGESDGDIAYARFSHLVRDAEAALRLVMSSPDVDPGRVGVIGQSEGAAIAMLLATRVPEVAFYVWQSGFVDTIENLGMLQFDAVKSMPPEAAAEMKSVVPYFYWEASSQVEIFQAAREGRETITLGDSDWSLELGLGYYRELMALDLERSIAQIGCPVLIVHGEIDDIVPLENAHRAEHALLAAGNPDVTLRVLPGISHSMNRISETEPEDGIPSEIVPDPQAIAMVAQWISDRVSVPGDN